MGQEESRSEEMDLAQIQELCILFMKECPSGALHLHEFKRIFGVPSTSAEESLYIETIFRSFDTNQVRGSRFRAAGRCGRAAEVAVHSEHFGVCLQDNTLDFIEYVAALHLILRGNLEDRLKWSFKMYDKDGNGKLDRHEVKRLIKVRTSNLVDSGDRIHVASCCGVSATLDCLDLPNGLSASRCYVTPVGLGFYFRC